MTIEELKAKSIDEIQTEIEKMQLHPHHSMGASPMGSHMIPDWLAPILAEYLKKILDKWFP